MYKIGVISDTHGLLREEVIDSLRGCDVILHGGDINRQSILDTLKKMAPVYAVRGNNDKEWAEYLPETVDITLYGIRIFMIHNKKHIQEDISDKDIIVYGHSHKYEEKTNNGQLWLNPGSCGARRFSLPITMAVIEVSKPGFWQVKRIDLPGNASAAASAAVKSSSTGEKDTGHSESSSKRECMSEKDLRKLVQSMMKDTDRGITVAGMSAKYSIPQDFAEQICRLYLTHPGIDAEGIINKMN